jgi:hypothetical protein
MSGKGYGKLLIVWAILMAAFIVVGVLVYNPFDYWRLAQRGVVAHARVTIKEPSNHRFVHYSYEVRGQTYSGIGNAGRGNPSFDEIEVGQELLAYYDPLRPSLSCLGNPANHLEANLTGVAFVMVVTPLFLLWVCYRRLSLFRTWISK